MDHGQDERKERVLAHALRLLCLLTGQDCVLLKRFGDSVKHLRKSGGGSRTQSPITDSPPHSLTHERDKEQKILELTNKIIQLLTGEVPIRCQDVTVYLSMEEWEYLEGHRDLYKDVLMENHSLHNSAGDFDIHSFINTASVHGADPPMEKYGNHVTEIILNLTVEMIELLSREKYLLIRTPGDNVTPGSHPCVSGGLSRTQSPITEPPPHSLIHERDNEQKILELTNKIIQLLTGEVPIRCQDVTVYLSMEEWEYIEKHEDLYKDVIRSHQLLVTRDGAPSANTCDTFPTLIDGGNPDHCDNDTKPQGVLSKPRNIRKKQKSFVKEESVPCEQGTRASSHPADRCKQEQSTAIRTEGKTDVRDSFTKAHSVQRKEEEEQERNIKCANEEEERNLKCASEEEESNINCASESLAADPCVSQGTGKVYKCSMCQKCFSSNAEYLRHRKTHKVLKLTCSDCGNPFSSIVGFEASTSKTGRAACGKCLSLQSRLTKDVDAKKNRFSCTECGKHFASKSSCDRHAKRHSKMKVYTCDECGKGFSNAANHLIHMRVHTGEKPYKCTECGKCFAQNTNLIAHYRIHTGEKPFACSECEKSFRYNSHLIAHKRYHTGQLLSCSECGKCFTYNSHLVIHRRIHAGLKPFACSECDKRFHRKCQLTQHMMRHTDEPPFQCKECNKCLRNFSDFTRHQKIHTGEKAFQCSECGKSFTRATGLAEHQMIHTGEKPYSCPECGKCFINCTLLGKHRRTHSCKKS
ncbi:zinc finger protein 26-like [Pseudophryne corroboree]|uniref:zinc finger protein 26-like n=1 Tax=Pseudophryne corroboree TaxID=495146 RepID=UPI003081AA48